MLESKVQRDIILYLTGLGYLVIKIESSSGSGYPDLLAMRTKRDLFFIECKQLGKDAEPLQEYRHRQLKSHGQKTYVFDSLEICMQTIKK